MKPGLLTLQGARQLAEQAGMTLSDACREIHALTGVLPSTAAMDSVQRRQGHLGRPLSAMFGLFFGLAYPIEPQGTPA